VSLGPNAGCGEIGTEMFTGLIADLGRVKALERDGDGVTLRVATTLAGELREGDSIAVDGVCLTATRILAGERGDDALVRDHASGHRAWAFEAQAMHETLQRSTLGELEVGAAVNLELALRADGRLGGHVVQGHVDGIARVDGVREDGFSRVLALALDAELLPYVVEKGSIALGGVSLTVSALRGDGIEVSLIPETLERTTLGRAAVGARVNVEVDVLAKHVARLLGAAAAPTRS
jgi:riboflavin synthase